MYFVDQQKIENTLQYLEEKLQLFQSVQEWKSPIELLALERIVHTAVESILDVGNAMIDGFIMRDPGSYEDIVDILMDEKVVSNDMGDSLKKIILFRKNLVQQYLEINHEEIKKAFEDHLHAFTSFPQSIRNYLKSELGPVSAFKND
ncbi:type VII toxin-antitoxin system HepT family RNase toxin [Neobacillus sp. D3-1R]|uniref:type VII toxin-antitoxin system HepT family RNase toxin n=1 Tax=Neobacillus sp. D3-1R TaxID=3445778 RepID=UPI003F9FA8FA